MVGAVQATTPAAFLSCVDWQRRFRFTLTDRHRPFEILLHTGLVVSSEEKWVDVEVVAKHIGVRRESIHRWIDRRGFPAHRVGRLLRFRLSEVDEWVRTSGSAMGDRAGRSLNEANDEQREEEQM